MIFMTYGHVETASFLTFMVLPLEVGWKVCVGIGAIETVDDGIARVGISVGGAEHWAK